MTDKAEVFVWLFCHKNGSLKLKPGLTPVYNKIVIIHSSLSEIAMILNRATSKKS